MKLFQSSLLLSTALADMYWQFPGGSNNRLNEPNRERRNANRLFDSQNNARQGFNQAGHYFYAGSTVDLQWTIQHSCGPDSNVNCNLVLQYGCHDLLRDGHTIQTIPDHDSRCKSGNCSSDVQFGMHESYDYYRQCALRERQKGLYPADRNINGETARFTRQENNGARYGYECNEERDYYPYWTPTIWKDIAVFVDSKDEMIDGKPICNFYQENSENQKGRAYCKVADSYLDKHYNAHRRDALIPLSEKRCNELRLEDPESEANWVVSEPHGIPVPACELNDYSRDNHHGNGDGENFGGYKWKIPTDFDHDQCTLRIRYNMTSADYDGWTTDYSYKIDTLKAMDREVPGSFHTPNNYRYKTVNRELAGVKNFNFSVKARNDAHIILKADNSKYMEIVIGGWANSRSVIRNRKQGTELTRKDERGVLNGNLYKNFSITWDDKDLVVLAEKLVLKNQAAMSNPRFANVDKDGVVGDDVGHWPGYPAVKALDGKSGSWQDLAHPPRQHMQSDFVVDVAPGTIIDTVKIKPRTNCCQWRYEKMAAFVNDVICLPKYSYNANRVRSDNELIFECPSEVDASQIRITNNPFKNCTEWKCREPVQIGELIISRKSDAEDPGSKQYIPLMTLEDYQSVLSNGTISIAQIATGWGATGSWFVDHDDEHEKSHGPDVWSFYGMDKFEARERGYYHQNDPQLKVFDDMDFKIALAYNTDQLGRVFEDRTHRISIRQAPSEVQDALADGKEIHNLNARGKIGNFVETYPNFEYEFVPKKLTANKGDYIHVQFSGSLTNDHGNDGSITFKEDTTRHELRGQDKYNLIAMSNSTSYTFDQDPSKVASVFGLSETDAMEMAFMGREGGGANNRVLQNTGDYFNLGLRKLEDTGSWYFYSPMNTRFGYRSQKGKLTVVDPAT